MGAHHRLVEPLRRRGRQTGQPKPQVLAGQDADDEVDEDAGEAEQFADAADGRRLVGPRGQRQPGDHAPRERQEPERPQVGRLDEAAEHHRREHRQSGEADEREPADPDERLREEDAPRPDRGDEEEFERLALGELRQPPPDERAALDDAEDEGELADGGQRRGRVGLRGGPGESGEAGDVQRDRPAERQVPGRRPHAGGEERLEHAEG